MNIPKIEKVSIQLRRGHIPTGKLSVIHYYILEDANFHTLNNTLSKMGKFGKFRVNHYASGDVYSPKSYGSPYAVSRFKQYLKKGGKTWQL